MKSDININEYFNLKNFIIPNYQRGYKWGVQKDNECAVSILLDSLINVKENSPDYYIQGVTVCETDGYVTLIDGQQRTTTLYLLLKYLNYDKLPEINYEIRQDSDKFLKSSNINGNTIEYIGTEKIDEDSQDIYYFKKAISTIHTKLNNINKETFKKNILEKVRLFYIKINPEDATKVFSMMNGQKAIMKDDELVKASLLSIASKKNNKNENSIAEEWETNLLRNKYAREWDRWLYWWNKESVKKFYGSGNNPMGLLLEYFYYLNRKKEIKEAYEYKYFKESFFENTSQAKQNYKAIRDLQKTFEDWFNDIDYYNYLGIIFKTGANKKEAILYFLKNNSIKIINDYAKWSIVGATHKQIIIKTQDQVVNEATKEDKAIQVLKDLSSKYVYGIHNDLALKQLLRKNVELDCKLKRKFDFDLYGEKSLEHIFPKSWENEEESKLKFDDTDIEKYSVHCIGNLVLLDRNTNSSFSNNSFDEKKKSYFNSVNVKWSLKLLHSVAVFSKNDWGINEIKENQKEFIEELKKYYNQN